MYIQNRETIVNVIKQMKRSTLTVSVAGLIGFAAVGLSAVMFLKALDVRRPQSCRSNADSPRTHLALVYISVK
jgi:hypothetical protein